MAVSCIEKINTTQLTVRILKLYNLHFFFLLHIKNSTNSLMRDKARQITVTQHFFFTVLVQIQAGNLQISASSWVSGDSRFSSYLNKHVRFCIF